MKKILTVLAVAFLLQYAWNDLGLSSGFQSPGSGSDAELAQAFENQRGDFQIQGKGEVVQVLPDDNLGSRHQRFILKLRSGQTLLVAHNIDLAPKISALSVGDSVEFYGEYEWNKRGGVIHWTHRDPGRAHEAGWLKHRGRIYQ